MAAVKGYNRLSVAEKEAHNRLHEPPTRCPDCDTAVQPDDLLAHEADRCPGRPDPHPRSRWVSHSAAIEMVPRGSLSRLSKSGRIRTTDRNGQKHYLVLDLVKYRHGRSQGSMRGTNSKRRAKRLTNVKRQDQREVVKRIRPLEAHLADRLKALAKGVDGFEPLSRLMDIPADTLRRAAAGENLRQATRFLVEAKIDGLGKTPA